MDYISMFDPIPWAAVGRSVLQTLVIFIIVVGGLRAVGRRVLGERSTQDLVILLLISDASNLGLNDTGSGFWGAIASVLTLLFLGVMADRIPILRHMLGESPVLLYKDGRLFKKRLKKYLVDEADLEHTARAYGVASYKQFSEMTLEGDGTISGVLRRERPHHPAK